MYRVCGFGGLGCLGLRALRVHCLGFRVSTRGLFELGFETMFASGFIGCFIVLLYGF